MELIARDGARVQYVAVQRLGRGTFYQSIQRTLAQRDSKLDTLNVALGASVTRVDLNARLLGPGANSDMLGLYFGDDDQHFDFNTSQDHVAEHTSSDLLYKGALDGASRAAFRGIIRVLPGAQGTDAYQTNRNLLLSPESRADSLPYLEIEAADIASRTIPTPYRFQKPRQLRIAGVDGQIEHIADGNQVDRAPDPNLAAHRLQGQRQFRVQNAAVNDAA